MADPVTAALIALGGVLVGLIGRDVVMALVLARRTRQDKVKDVSESRARARHDLVRLYADPLREAAKSLRFRLDEIIGTAQTRYLLANTPKTNFVQYKRISTIYRLAALLGWIRAFRRERSYLDPDDVAPVDPKTDPISRIEQALADGQHVEEQRLDELMSLWKVPKDILTEGSARSRLAGEIDAARQEFLGERTSLSASELNADDRIKLARRCANLITEIATVDIPQQLVDATAAQASLFLGIKEAYVYRDWQAAVGDLMILQISGGPRRFDVIGFGEFEDRYLRTRRAGSAERRWFDRLEKLFHDLDVTRTGMFDARRQQIRNLHEACKALEEYLAQRIVHLRDAT